jgi:hypothetical protein
MVFTSDLLNWSEPAYHIGEVEPELVCDGIGLIVSSEVRPCTSTASSTASLVGKSTEQVAVIVIVAFFVRGDSEQVVR